MRTSSASLRTMSIDLKKCERPISSGEINGLCEIIRKSPGLSEKEIRRIWKPAKAEEEQHLLMTLSFLVQFEIIRDEADTYYFSDDILEDPNEVLIKKVAKFLCSELGEGIFHYDYLCRRHFLINSKIPTAFSFFRNYLIDAAVLSQRTVNELIVSEKYEDLFPKRNVKSEFQLEEELKRKKDIGDKAEKFVLQYEKDRLKDSPLISNVRIISKEDVTAGFDIISFDNVSDKFENRFIEVKGFLKEIRFFWSTNEISIAKKLGQKYHIYLVDVEEMDQDGYEPTILDDPANAVLLNPACWIPTCCSIEFKKNNYGQ